MAKKRHSLYLTDHEDLQKTSDYANPKKKYTRIRRKPKQPDEVTLEKTEHLIEEANHSHMSVEELTEEVHEINQDEAEKTAADFDAWLSK